MKLLQKIGAKVQVRFWFGQEKGIGPPFLFYLGRTYLSPAERLSQNTQASPSFITQTQPKYMGSNLLAQRKTQKKINQNPTPKPNQN